MIPLTLAEIAQATSGRIMPPATSADRTLAVISTNSKQITPGCLFLALKGDRFDGHDFIPQVVGSGAAAVVVHRLTPELPVPQILVGDTRVALGALGNFVRRRFAGQVIAIGGSNGKTTTKHLAGSVLGAQMKGTQSPKSFNNDIGVPLTLLEIKAEDAYVILELGTNHPGELSPLTRLAAPDIAIITSIGAEHLEGFGNLEGVRREEATLLDGLKSKGLVIANGDDADFLQLIRPRVKRLLTFGFGAHNDLAVSQVDCTLEGIHFVVQGSTYELPLPGRHNASNALAAIALGRELGLSEATIRRALANCSRPEMRMQVGKIGAITILNDAYNANPASMRAALETLSQARVPGRRIAILGEMRELGNSSAEAHRDIGELAARSQLDLLICVGGDARAIADAALAAKMEGKLVRCVPDAAAAAAVVPGLLQDDDTVLLKASRSVKLELVARAIADAKLTEKLS